MDSDEKRNIKKVVFTIIIIFIFIYLIVYIYTEGTAIFFKSKEIAEQKRAESLDCAIYSFSIIEDATRYENNNLEFMVRNTIGEAFEKLVVKIDGEEYVFELIDFQRNSPPQKILIEDVVITQEVEIYPFGCKDHKKTIRI